MLQKETSWGIGGTASILTLKSFIGINTTLYRLLVEDRRTLVREVRIQMRRERREEDALLSAANGAAVGPALKKIKRQK